MSCWTLPSADSAHAATFLVIAYRKWTNDYVVLLPQQTGPPDKRVLQASTLHRATPADPSTPALQTLIAQHRQQAAPTLRAGHHAEGVGAMYAADRVTGYRSMLVPRARRPRPIREMLQDRENTTLRPPIYPPYKQTIKRWGLPQRAATAGAVLITTVHRARGELTSWCRNQHTTDAAGQHGTSSRQRMHALTEDTTPRDANIASSITAPSFLTTRKHHLIAVWPTGQISPLAVADYMRLLGVPLKDKAARAVAQMPPLQAIDALALANSVDAVIAVHTKTMPASIRTRDALRTCSLFAGALNAPNIALRRQGYQTIDVLTAEIDASRAAVLHQHTTSSAAHVADVLDLVASDIPDSHCIHITYTCGPHTSMAAPSTGGGPPTRAQTDSLTALYHTINTLGQASRAGVEMPYVVVENTDNLITQHTDVLEHISRALAHALPHHTPFIQWINPKIHCSMPLNRGRVYWALARE